jgi:NTE family protein
MAAEAVVSCMLPGRSGEFSTNVFPVDFIIACDAGVGMSSGARRPTFWISRMLATVITIHRRTQTMTQNMLHRMKATGEIQGFLMPYLGQQDSALPVRPADLVTRDQVFDYPTNFNPMSKENIEKLKQQRSPILNQPFDELSYGCGSACHAAFFILPPYTSSGRRPARD